ncbi:putative gustatory receptor 97a [Drosophila grimshawi]|uniref:Gustatory receptor n=1 Tax=Drosophila grimshawi TaxID=7222 RepID=B4JHI3_DROGR|nr:putative gustatory receptor 97a [Drosophila grimshawi]EDV92810.1 GH18967 [Drosophila grimshawi]
MQYVKAAGRRIKLSWNKPRRTDSWILASKVLLCWIAVSIVQNIAYGLYPGRFCWKQNQFVFNKLLGIYCLAVATFFGIFYGNRIWEDYDNGKIDLRNPIQIYCYMNACVGLFNYVTQWTIMPEILSFQNSIPLFSTINFLNISMRSAGRPLVLACLKWFGCPLLLQLTLTLYHSQQNWMITLKIMIPIYLANQINNCFFGSMVMAELVIAEINNKLRSIVAEVNRLQTPSEMILQKRFYRMQRFCDLADRVDELKNKYTMSTGYSIAYLELTAFSLVVSMAINLISTTLGCYTLYQAVADHLLLEQPYNVIQSLVHLVFIVVPFTEMYLLARISQKAIEQAKETGNMLQQINQEHADIRFKQVVDAFWLDVSLIKYKLVPMGLFELNNSVTNIILSTVAGFLLFLIQNDLTLRFSLN